MSAEWDEELGYDADHSDARQYCEHGTWIGSWWGPDYLCGYCEEGVTMAELIVAREYQARRERVLGRWRLKKLYWKLRREGINPSWVTYLVIELSGTRF